MCVFVCGWDGACAAKCMSVFFLLLLLIKWILYEYLWVTEAKTNRTLRTPVHSAVGGPVAYQCSLVLWNYVCTNVVLDHLSPSLSCLGVGSLFILDGTLSVQRNRYHHTCTHTHTHTQAHTPAHAPAHTQACTHSLKHRHSGDIGATD